LLASSAASDVYKRQIFIAATADSYFRAFDIDTGEILWAAELPTTGNAVPMTYVYRGQQYVVIAAGGHFTSPAESGDHVIAYRLPAQTGSR
ncbi:MAG: PQQ-binding-like beta-propeller repeat protein, partial [Pseudomonadales bacterium]|nr:PQQ-binding-like beta-propeller repeat protein [Pseudomonadales bacterium]